MSILPLKNTHQPFNWVKPELDKSVSYIRAALETYGRDLNNFEPLLPVVEQLHLLRGSLYILELYGASLLVEDMEKTVRAILGKSIPSVEDAFEALVKATISLEGYLEKLAKDPADIPVILLPIINDLRASRNEPLLTESNLFNPNLSIVPKFPDQAALRNDLATQMAETAKSLRPYFQAALLSWYRNPKDTLSLQQMKLVLRNLESSSYAPRTRQLWWIAGGLAEALADGGVHSNVSIRLLLGQVDRMIKTIVQHKETSIEKSPPIDLLKNILFYVAHSASRGERVATLKRAYQLESLIPSELDLRNLRENIRNPKSESFNVIANELNKTIQKIKVVIDADVRGNNKETTQIKDVLLPLKHIADTLSLISLGKERQLLLKQIEHITQVTEQQRVPTRDELMSLASAIVHIESVITNIGNERRISDRPIDKLNEKRRTRQMASMTMENTGQGSMLNRLPETEYRVLVQKAAEEARNNVISVKNNILAFLTSPLKQKLISDVPRLLNEIRGCLIIIDHIYASDLVKALSDYTQKNLLGQEIQPQKSELDEFAEAIVGLEFYLESIAEGRAQLESILEITRESLLHIGYKVDPPKQSDAKTIPILESIVTRIHDTQKTKTGKHPDGIGDAKLATQETKETKIVALELDEEVDPEVKQIFIEEALGELEQLENNLAALKLSLEDKLAIGNIRRVYHTLKGSGRIAGANPISEFATVLEEYVNRLLVGALTLDTVGLKLLADAYPILQQLIVCYRDKTAPPVNVNKLVHEIIALMEDQPIVNTDEGDDIEPSELTELVAREVEAPEEPAPKAASVVLPLETKPTKEISTAPIIPADLIDSGAFAVVENDKTAIRATQTDDEIDTTCEDALLAISVVETFIQERRESGDVSPISDDVLTAVEDLYQTTFKINIREFAQTTELLLRYVRNIANYHSEVQSETLDILSEFCATTREMIGSHRQLKSPSKEIDRKSQNETQSLDNGAAIQSAVRNKPATEMPTEPDEQDLTLIDIFLEEARDLLEQGNSNLEQWQNQRPDTDFLEGLQRILHTLKGSARMAGITIIGNIGHALESIIEEVINDEIERVPGLNDLIQKGFDAIADVIESLNKGGEIRNFDELFADIRQFVVTHQTKPASDEILTEAKSAIDNNNAAIAPVETLPLNETLSLAEASAEELDTPSSISIESEIVEPNISVDTPIVAPISEPISDIDRKSEPVKIDTKILDSLVNAASEENIAQHRIEDHVNSIKSSLLELDRTISRLRIQIRDVEYDVPPTKTPSASSIDIAKISAQQEGAQRLLESIGDLENLHGMLTRLTLETDNFLHQQRKIHSELYEGLLGARMITFANQSQRFQKIVRQTARDLNKKVRLEIQGTDGSLDRALLDRLMGPIEHLLRNAVAHGIESPDVRKNANKDETGSITLSLNKEGSDYVVRIADDGGGINVNAIRQKAIRTGLIKNAEHIGDDDLIQLIFEPGFSTSDSVSQIAGRGVGMDVVNRDIQSLGGSVFIETEPGRGTTFTLRVPYTVSLNKTIIVRCGDNVYAIPSTAVDGVQPMSHELLDNAYHNQRPSLVIEKEQYPLWYLNTLLNEQATVLPGINHNAPVLILRNNRTRAAIQVDEVLETKDTILKPTGQQLARAKGITGATVLDEGQIALIIDVPTLLRMALLSVWKDTNLVSSPAIGGETTQSKVLVVDDSITVRKVTERFLKRYGFSVTTARDGVEALEQVEQNKPDVILLDIEMPRMDGLEVTRQIRARKHLADIPIIMITSRAGKLHREAAQQAGVNVFMGKPYQESQLLEQIRKFAGANSLTSGN